MIPRHTHPRPPCRGRPRLNNLGLRASTYRILGALGVGILVFLLPGCRTGSAWRPIDLAEPGWTVRTGQAVWRPSVDAESLAGELLVAWHEDGRAFLQFSKTPLPILVGQVEPHGWQIQFAADNQRMTRPGPPPSRLTWLHLPFYLRHPERQAEPSLVFERLPADSWSLLNRETGESIQGYLNP